MAAGLTRLGLPKEATHYFALHASIDLGYMVPAPFVTLASGGDRPPLYFICGVNLYRPLARRLGRQQPSYGVYLALEEAILAGAASGPHTAEALASRYAQALCREHPSGPLCVAGVSFGAILAYEVARQLRAADREVPLLILLDPVLESSVVHNPTYWLRSQLDKALREGPRAALAGLTRRLWQSGSPALTAAAGEGPADDPDAAHGQRNAFYRALAARYERGWHGYDGRVVMVRAADHVLEHHQLQPDLGWGSKLQGPLRVFQAPGDHLSFLRDEATAAILRHELDRTYGSAAEAGDERQAATAV